MQIQFHKLNNAIVCWNTGAEGQIAHAETIVYEIDDEDWHKLQAGTHRPQIVNGQIVYEKTAEALAAEADEQQRQDLKEKLHNGTMTTKDMQEALKLLL